MNKKMKVTKMKMIRISYNNIFNLTTPTKYRGSIFIFNFTQIRTFSQTFPKEKNRTEVIDLSLLDYKRPILNVSELYLTSNKRILFNNYDSVMNQSLENFDPLILRKFYSENNARLEEVNYETNILKDLLKVQSNTYEDYSYEIDGQCLTLFLREHEFLTLKKDLILNNRLETGLSTLQFDKLKLYLEQQDYKIQDLIYLSERIHYGVADTETDTDLDSNSNTDLDSNNYSDNYNSDLDLDSNNYSDNSNNYSNNSNNSLGTNIVEGSSNIGESSGEAAETSRSVSIPL